MKQIETKPLTLENFKKYGSFSDMSSPAGTGGGIPGMTFYPDLEVLELGQAHMAAFSVTQVKKELGHTILALEQHAHCGEGIMSLDGDMLVYFAPAGLTYPAAADKVEAFLVPKHVMLTIRPGVWHCMPFVVRGEEIHVLNVLPERTYANDCTMHVLKEEERIKINLQPGGTTNGN